MSRVLSVVRLTDCYIVAGLANCKACTPRTGLPVPPMVTFVQHNKVVGGCKSGSTHRLFMCPYMATSMFFLCVSCITSC